MSADNVEIVRRLYDAFARRDNEYPFTVFAEDIKWDMPDKLEPGRALPLDLTGVFVGHDGVRDFWRVWLAAWAEVDFELGGLASVGDDVIAFIPHQRMHARATGLWMEMPPYAQIWKLRDGKVTRMRYTTIEEASELVNARR